MYAFFIFRLVRKDANLSDLMKLAIAAPVKGCTNKITKDHINIILYRKFSEPTEKDMKKLNIDDKTILIKQKILKWCREHLEKISEIQGLEYCSNVMELSDIKFKELFKVDIFSITGEDVKINGNILNIQTIKNIN